jgi:hypothetical protein
MQKALKLIGDHYRAALVICAFIVTVSVFWKMIVIPNQARADFLSCMGETEYRYTLDSKDVASEMCNRYQYWAHK